MFLRDYKLLKKERNLRKIVNFLRHRDHIKNNNNNNKESSPSSRFHV